MGTGITITVNAVDITAYCKIETLRIEEVGTQDVATAYFEAEDHTGTITISGKHTVDIRPTGGAAATILFAGEVGRVVKGQRGVTKTWEVSCQDNNVLLDERVVASVSYAAASADSDIIDDLFTNYRSDINSTDEVDTINASMEAIEFEEMTLRECLDAICAITGGRYYVDYQKKLHYFNTEAGNTASFDLSTSPDFASTYPFGGFSLVEDGTRVTTHVRVVGEDAEGWYPATQDWSADERHALVRDRSAVNAAAVEDVGTAVYNRYSSARQTYRLYTEQDGLRAGQSIGLVNATWSIDSTFWIRELKMVVLDKAGDKRRYHLVLNDESPSPARMARHRQMDTSAQAEIDVTLSARGWGHDLTFSASDDDTVAWTGGTITLADGHTTYSIDAGNTGNMAALTYIYLDTDVSLTVLQTTTTAATAIGKYKILIAVAAQSGEAGKDATFQVFGGKGGVGVFITADNIAANTITANEISANTITAAEIAADTITAAEIAAATITGTEIAASTITADKLSIGQMPFDLTDGSLLVGPPHKVIDEGGTYYWVGSRGQRITLGGAIQQAPGRWPGTKAMRIVMGATNLVQNPRFEVNITDWWTAVYNGTGLRVTTAPRHGAANLKLTADASTNPYIYKGTAVSNPAQDDYYTFSAWVKGAADTVGKSATVNIQEAGGVEAAAYTTETITLTGYWQEVSVTRQIVEADRTALNVWVRIICDNTEYAYVDGVQLTATNHKVPYFDGSMGSGFAWSGTADNSTSTVTGSTNTIAALGNIDNEDVAVAIWFKIDHWSPNGTFLWTAGDINGEFDAYVGSNGTVYFRTNTNSLSSSAGAATEGEWHEIVAAKFSSNNKACDSSNQTHKGHENQLVRSRKRTEKIAHHYSNCITYA